MQFGSYGVYQGGHVTVADDNSHLVVAPLIVKSSDNRNLGFGAPARQVIVLFDASLPSHTFETLRVSDFDAPNYTLRIGSAAGSAYLVFDTHQVQDIRVVDTPTTEMVILAEIEWPEGATSMADVVLNFSERQESRILETGHPLQAEDLYTAGMPFTDTSFNAPLIGFALLSEVLQGEALAKNSDTFSFVVINESALQLEPARLTVQPFRMLLRRMVDGQPVYRAVQTKTPFEFDYNVTELAGERIYVWASPENGEVYSGVSYSPENGVLVAYGNVTTDMTSLTQVKFILSSEIAESNAQSGATIAVQAATLPSGFLQPVTFTRSTSVHRTATSAEAIALIKGMEFLVPQTMHVFPAAPESGSRLDLLFAEFYREVESAPPLNRSFYLQVPGVGYVVTKVRFRIATDVDYAPPETILLHSSVSNDAGYAYYRHESGHYEAPDVRAYDGYTFALPLALVSRFNQAVFSTANLFGGGLDAENHPTRPDGKSHVFFHADEWETLAPVTRLSQASPAEIFGKALSAVLKGENANQMAPCHLVPDAYSKRPLQHDVIAPLSAADLGLFQRMSVPDGVRREWSANPQPYWLGTNFVADADAVSALHTYEEGTRTLSISAPVDALLELGGLGGNQPVVALNWLESGRVVVLQAPWVVGVDGRSAAAILDRTDAHFNPSGTIVLSFAVRQQRSGFMAHMPNAVLRALYNGAAMTLAEVVPPNRRPALPPPPPAGELPVQVTPVGDPKKGDARALFVRVVADGSNLLMVPNTIAGVAVLGVIGARIVGGAELTIRYAEHEDPATPGAMLKVWLSEAILTGETVELKLSVGGMVANIVPQHAAITDFASSGLWSFTTLGETSLVRLALPANTVLRGVFSFFASYIVSIPEVPASVHGVYIDNFLYPVSVSGFDRNLVELNFLLSPEVFNLLPESQQAKWEPDPANLAGYRLKAGSYQLRLPALLSHAMAASDVVQLLYQYQSAPYIPAPVLGSFKLLHRGWLLATNSSLANQSNYFAAPVCEKLPLVQGSTKGADAAQVETNLQDPLRVTPLAELPIEGVEFSLDKKFDFDVGVVDPDAGVIAWFALVAERRYVKLFCYMTENESLTVDVPNRAFLTYCDAHYVV
jgi:hypothetical protein